MKYLVGFKQRIKCADLRYLGFPIKNEVVNMGDALD